jgi:hypothetical protein
MKRCGALFVLLLSTMSAAAFAQEGHAPEDQSKAAFESGARHYERGEFRAAAEAFREAHQLSPQPALLYNLAQAERLDGQCELALAHYEEFVATYSGAVPVAVVEKITEMKRCVQTARQRSEAAAVVLKPEAGTLARATTSPPRGASPKDDHAREQAPFPEWLGWSATAIGAAGLVAGAVMGAMVLHKQSIVEDTCPNKQCRDPSGIAAAGDGKKLLVGTIAGLGLGAAGVGVAIYVWTRGDSNTRVDSSRTWFSAPSGAIVTWSGAF